MSVTRLQILRLSQLGEGIAEHEGRAIFVPGTFPGDEIEATVTEQGRVLRGTLTALLAPSADRRPSPCDVPNCCGGFEWLELGETAQRKAKQEIVLSTLEHLGGIPRTSLEVRELLAGRSLGSRRRAVLHFTREGLGLFERGSHTRRTVQRCPMLSDPLTELPGRLGALLKPLAKDGEAVHLLAEGDQVAFAVLLKGAVRPRHTEAVEAALAKLRLRGAVIVPKDGSPVELRKPVLRALSPLTPEVPLFLRPDAFAQANAELNVGLVSAAVQQLAPTEADRVLELYSGNGNFTFPIAGVAREVLAVEGAAVSVELARRSAREGGVENVRFVLDDVARSVKGRIAEGERFDLLLADPPRTGAPGIGGWAQALGVRRVVYVACDPAALARDAKGLVAAGFRPTVLQVADMFPQTRHVEAVLSFERAG